MILYCDTSAIVKRYIEETGTKHLQILLSQSSYLLTSALTELELLSFAEKAKRMGRLLSPDYRNMIAAIEKDFERGFLVVTHMTKTILELSKRLIRQRSLRPPDALQLATAIYLKNNLPEDISFCCADHALIRAATLEGLKCEDVS